VEEVEWIGRSVRVEGVEGVVEVELERLEGPLAQEQQRFGVE
jgi:hypothetical protein